jgi:propanol-preferring alcohol dehydrogenase
MELAPRIPIRTNIVEYPLREANQALAALRSGSINGAAVLTVGNHIASDSK